jgi:xanthine/CO dehydrogenase XdhC/CoxF family maturation factor
VSESIDILSAVLARHERGDRYGLATVVNVRGSTYRLPGARQLVAETGESVGTVSGGCLDADVQEVTRQVLTSGQPRLITFDLTADDEAIWGWGLGCNGATELLVEPPDSAGRLAIRLHDAITTERSLAVVTVLESAELAVGARLFVEADGTSEGSLGSDAADLAAGRLALTALEAGAHQTTALGGSRDRVFVEVVMPPPRLLVCGAGHDAIPLVRLGAELGWHVVVTDERKNFLDHARFPGASHFVHARPGELAGSIDLDRRTDAVVMSHTYLRDVDYLQVLLDSRVRYIGMLGPKARSERILDHLQQQGIEIKPQDLDRIHGPAGLDIGAEGPEEIAYAIMAEVLAVRRGREAGFLRERKVGIHGGTTDSTTTNGAKR